MQQLALNYFPYPYIYEGLQNDGFQIKRPKQCILCKSKGCEKNTDSGIKECEYGFNFIRLKKTFIIIGLVVHDIQGSAAHTKNGRRFKVSRITKDALTLSSNPILNYYTLLDQKASNEKLKAVETTISKNQYSADFLEALRPEIQKSFSYIHDYKQFISQVIQNINVIIENQYDGKNFADKLECAKHEEVAIYWASKLMDQKLITSQYLVFPEKIFSNSPYAFKLHSLVLKYVRIYQKSFDSAKITIRIQGKSFGRILGSEAVSVIPHTLIDNARKYAPRNSEIIIKFEETESEIIFSVSSYGPRINKHEERKIFDIFYRSPSAKAVSEGSGFGLYLAQFIALNLDTSIKVEQESKQKPTFGHWTVFSVTFNRHD